MISDDLKNAVKELLLEHNEDASEPTLSLVAHMVAAVSEMRRTGQLPEIPIETLADYVDGSLPEDERLRIEKLTPTLPTVMADLEMVRAMPSLDEAEDLGYDVPDEAGPRILARVKAVMAKERITAEGSEPATIPFREPTRPPKWAELVRMAASWLGPVILAIEGCRELLFVTQATGPVFMGGRADLQRLPEVEGQGGPLVVRVGRTGEPSSRAREVWALDPTGRIVHRAPLDEHGMARFENLPAGKYRINTDRGIGEVKARL